MERHAILAGKVHLFRRPRSKYWQCSAYVGNIEHRKSSKQESLALAKDFAEDWYLGMRGKLRDGELLTEKSFNQCADYFELEYETITQGTRSPKWVQGHKDRLRLHLRPFFGNMGISTINAGTRQEYEMHRINTSPEDKRPAHKTIHNEIVTLRQVLKTAERQRWLSHVPDLSAPYRRRTKISHRPWFSPKEYKQLYTATRDNARNPKRERDRRHAEDLHDFVLFMANTGLRPDEVYNIEHRDVEIVEDIPTGETILEIEVRGKQGFGYCKSTAGAVRPYERVVERNQPEAANEKVFPVNHLRMFNTILEAEDLKVDRDGKRRTSYSLRHTYICLRLMEGADIYQIAKNCRTSVEMIEKHYAAHIKNTIDASAINIRNKRIVKPRLVPLDEDE